MRSSIGRSAVGSTDHPAAFLWTPSRWRAPNEPTPPARGGAASSLTRAREPTPTNRRHVVRPARRRRRGRARLAVPLERPDVGRSRRRERDVRQRHHCHRHDRHSHPHHHHWRGPIPTTRTRRRACVRERPGEIDSSRLNSTRRRSLVCALTHADDERNATPPRAAAAVRPQRAPRPTKLRLRVR